MTHSHDHTGQAGKSFLVHKTMKQLHVMSSYIRYARIIWLIEDCIIYVPVSDGLRRIYAPVSDGLRRISVGLIRLLTTSSILLEPVTYKMLLTKLYCSQLASEMQLDNCAVLTLSIE